MLRKERLQTVTDIDVYRQHLSHLVPSGERLYVLAVGLPLMPGCYGGV
jgi:hypothetical protein